MGSLIALVSLCLIGGGGTLLWADRTQRDAGYVTSGGHRFSTSGSALTTERVDLGSGGTGWLYGPGLLDEVRIRVTATNPGSAVFAGIGPSDDVDRYLAGVRHTVISDFWSDRVLAIEGSILNSAPGAQDFWVAVATGPGTQNLEWDPADGSWTVVVMNADGAPGIDVRADLGARLPALPWVALGVLAAGAVFGVGGALLIVGALRHTGPRTV